MSISRRKFLGGVAAGAGAVVAGSGRARGHGHAGGQPGRQGLLHDTTLCVGCRSCEAACSSANNLPAPAPPPGDMSVFARRRRTSARELTVVNRYDAGAAGRPVFRKQQCMHCNEPCCAAVCFVRAFTKTPAGPVVYDPDVCVGCRYCVMACPYNALGYEYDEPLTPRVMRCTMCHLRIEEGAAPACADVCPTGAITYGPRSELLRLARERIRKQPGQYIDHIFGEHEFGGTSWLVLAGVSFGSLGLPENAGPTPLPELTSSFLSVVPLVLSIYPGLLLGMRAFTRRKEQLARKEQAAAVAEALSAAEADAQRRLAAASERATRDKDKAVEQAVKKALAEAAARESAGKEGGQ